MNSISWDAAAVAVKTVLYAATLGASGGVFFLWYAADLLSGDERAAIRRSIQGALAFLVLGTVLRIAIAGGSLSGVPSGMFDVALLRMVWESGEGPAAQARVLGALLMCAVLLGESKPHVVALGGASLAATSFAWTGHTHATQAQPLLVVALGAHLLTAAFWLGALLPLWIVLRHGSVRRAAVLARRFGVIARYAVGLLVLAGTLLACSFVGQVAALWTSSYGRLLVLKLLGVGVLLMLASLNHWHLTPRLAQAAAGGEPRAALRRSVIAEIGIAAGLLVVTAVLTTVAGPPRFD